MVLIRTLLQFNNSCLPILLIFFSSSLDYTVLRTQIFMMRYLRCPSRRCAPQQLHPLRQLLLEIENYQMHPYSACGSRTNDFCRSNPHCHSTKSSDVQPRCVSNTVTSLKRPAIIISDMFTMTKGDKLEPFRVCWAADR